MSKFWSGKKTILLWVAALIWMAVIFFFSSRPSYSIPHFFPDYVFHFLAYVLLAVLVFEALFSQEKEWPLVSVSTLAIIITVIYAATDEFHQFFIPTRTASISDWLVDSLAAFLVVALEVMILKRTSIRA